MEREGRGKGEIESDSKRGRQINKQTKKTDRQGNRQRNMAMKTNTKYIFRAPGCGITSASLTKTRRPSPPIHRY